MAWRKKAAAPETLNAEELMKKYDRESNVRIWEGVPAKIIRYICADDWYQKVPKNLTLLITSGANDPVGDMGKGPAEVYDKLQAAGCQDVNLLLYEDMRHEILNEIGKDRVWEDMRDFVMDMAEEHGLPADQRGLPEE